MVRVQRSMFALGVLALGFVAYGSAASESYSVSASDASSMMELHVPNPAGQLLPAGVSYAVFDSETGALWFGQGEDRVRQIASITKLFASAAVIETFNLTEQTELSWADLQSVGTAGRLQLGERYTYRDLLFPLLLSSSNNAALVFERRSQGEVVSAMQAWIDRRGAAVTRLADASGLAVGNVSSARDLAGLTVMVRNDSPLTWAITRLTSQLGPYGGWENNNPFIGDSTYRGGKNGFMPEAGRTVTAIFEEEIAGEAAEFGYIILGSDDLVRDMQVLRQYVQTSASWQ